MSHSTKQQTASLACCWTPLPDSHLFCKVLDSPDPTADSQLRLESPVCRLGSGSAEGALGKRVRAKFEFVPTIATGHTIAVIPRKQSSDIMGLTSISFRRGVVFAINTGAARSSAVERILISFVLNHFQTLSTYVLTLQGCMRRLMHRALACHALSSEGFDG